MTIRDICFREENCPTFFFFVSQLPIQDAVTHLHNTIRATSK